MKLNSTLGQLRILAILEGISYLLLIPTIILKYGFEMGLPNKIVGSLHGLLFVLYSFLVNNSLSNYIQCHLMVVQTTPGQNLTDYTKSLHHKMICL